MPYTTVVAGTTITASYANANLRDQTVVPFASTAARDSAITVPVVGMVEYLSTNASTEGLTTRNSAGQWRLPWNMPWGVVASVENSATGQSGISTIVDVTGLSVTFTAVANRYYRTSFYVPDAQQVTSTGNAFFFLVVDGTQVQRWGMTQTASSYFGVGGMHFGTQTAGSHTFKVQASTSAGTLTIAATSSERNYIVVEDVGPSGAPS